MLGFVRKTCIAKELLQKTISSTCFLNSYAFCRLYNNCKLFQNIQPKNIDFMTTTRQIIQISKVKIVAIPLFSRKTIELNNVIFTSDYDSNRIFFNQLCKSNITYHNKPRRIILKKVETVIVYAKQECNLFLFDFAISRVVIVVKSLKLRAMAISS